MKKNKIAAIQAVSRHYSEAISIARWTLVHNTQLELGAYLEDETGQSPELNRYWLIRQALLLDILLNTETGQYEWASDGRFHEGKGGTEIDYAQLHHDVYQGLAQVYMLPDLVESDWLQEDDYIEVNSYAADMLQLDGDGLITKRQLRQELQDLGVTTDLLRLTLANSAEKFLLMQDNIHAEARRLEVKAGLVKAS